MQNDLVLARKYLTLSFKNKNNQEECILTGQFQHIRFIKVLSIVAVPWFDNL